MKKLISGFLAFAFVLTIISCGGSSDKETKDVNVTDTEELIDEKLEKMVEDIEEAVDNIDAELEELENEVDSLLND
jgi:peptidoglycan hydrolase CwlO-like protein